MIDLQDQRGMIFNTSAIEHAMVLQGRNPNTQYGKVIRATLNSWGNHTALIVWHPEKGWMVAEAKPPHATYTSLAEYEGLLRMGYLIRIWRIRSLTMDQRIAISDYWSDHCDGVPYPPKISMARLAIIRFVNNLPWKMKRMHM